MPMQKILIIGHLAKDPELKNTANGKTICTLSVPVSEKRSEQESTEWFRVKCFGKTAEFCGKYLSKGRLVYVEGKLQTQKYTDKSGVERSITEVIADTVQGLDRAGNGQQSQPARQSFGSETYAAPMEDLPF